MIVRGVCSLSSRVSLFGNVWFQIAALFFWRRGSEGRKVQPLKAPTMCTLFSIFRKSDPNLSLTKFRETLKASAV